MRYRWITLLCLALPIFAWGLPPVQRNETTVWNFTRGLYIGGRPIEVPSGSSSECLRGDGTWAACGAGGGGGTPLVIWDEGVSLTQRNALAFLGTGVACVDNPGTGRTECTIAGAPSLVIADEGNPLTQRSTLSFYGAGVTCADNAGASRTECTIPGGGGGGSGTVTNTGTLAANRFILGNSGSDVIAAASISGLVLGNGAGAPSAYTGSTPCAAQFVRAISATGTTTCASVSATTDMSGTLQAAQFPSLTGHVTTSAGSLNTTIASGVVTNSMVADVAASKLTGTLQSAQFPALTGNVTTTAGSLATTIAAGAVTNAMLAGSIDLATKVTGLLPAANGGLGLSSAPDDTVITGTGTIWQARLLPNCLDTAGQHLNYDTSTNTWICGTSTSGITAVTAFGTLPADELVTGNGGTQIKTATMPMVFRAEDTSVQLSVTSTQGAVDYVEVQAGLAGVGATVAATSVIDANVPLGLVAQGDACVNVGNGTSLAPLFQACSTAVQINTNIQLSGMLFGQGSQVITNAPASGDYSKSRHETYTVVGATTAGVPTTGSLTKLELTPHYLYMNTDSGHVENNTTGDGHTILLAYNTSLGHVGQGYLGAYFGGVTIASTNPSSTHFLANPSGGVFSGHTFAGIDGVFLNPIEIHNDDLGYDVAAIGMVLGFDRTNNTGAKGNIWTGIRLASTGTKPLDNGFVASGLFNAGVDLSTGNFGTGKAAITIKDADRIYFKSIATPDASGFTGKVTSFGPLYAASNTDALLVNHTLTSIPGSGEPGSITAEYVGNYSSGTVAHGRALRALAQSTGAGNHSFLEGISASVTNSGGGTATYAAGIHIVSPSGTNITNSVGFFIEDIQNGGTGNYAVLLQQSTGYAIIHTGVAPTYLGGPLQLPGTTDATSTTTGNVTNAGGMSVLKRVFFGGLNTDAGATDNTLCLNSTTKEVLTGTGTLGVCLGTSSARYKHDIIAFTEDVLPRLDALQPITFRYNEGYGDNGIRRQYGFTAEDVVHIFPELVGKDEDGLPNTVDILGLLPILVRGMQQQQVQIRLLEEHVQRLSAKH